MILCNEGVGLARHQVGISILLSPLLLFLSGVDERAHNRAAHSDADQHLTPREEGQPPAEEAAPGWSDMLSIVRDDTARQVRIERSIRIRVSPRRGRVTPDSLLSQLPRGGPTARLVERKAGSCLPAANIAGVQVGKGNRLVLYMRDRRIYTGYLEKACVAREFYSGFYVERSADGQLCIDRDKLQSRAGGTCRLGRIGQLVAVRE